MSYQNNGQSLLQRAAQNTHNKIFFLYFFLSSFFFAMFAMGEVHISLPKKPPSRKYAKSKYHQSLLHATEPQATTALEHSSYF